MLNLNQVTKPKVTLLHHTPLYVSGIAIRTCWQSQDKSDTEFWKVSAGGEVTDADMFDFTDAQIGSDDCALIDRVGNKFKHASTLEHVYFNFYLRNVSRALLQELARHRMASLSVKSTRYTLKELKDEAPFDTTNHMDIARAEKYLVFTGVGLVDTFSVDALENLRKVLVAGISNDRAKYCLPDAYKTELTWTINIRSLQNFIYLRSDKSALWEIRNLANAIYEALPEEVKYLFNDHLKVYPEKEEINDFVMTDNLPETPDWDGTVFSIELAVAVRLSYKTIVTPDGCRYKINSKDSVTSLNSAEG